MTADGDYMYEIKNMTNYDIIINNKPLFPKQKIWINSVDEYKKIINLGYIKIINCNNNGDYDKGEIEKNINPIKEKKYKQIQVEDELNKDKLIEIIFKLFVGEELSRSELSQIKLFYREMCFTKNVSEETIKLLNDVECSEELIEVLINNIYSELINKFIDNKY